MKTVAPTASPNRPWWREPMVWLVIGGPAVVVVAAITTGIIAWRGADPLEIAPVEVPAHIDPSLEPAMKGRNHAASPRSP